MMAKMKARKDGDMSIRIKLRELAKARGIGQRRVAKKADLDLSIVQRIYQNPHANITLATLEKLARALDVEPGELLELDPPRSSSATIESASDDDQDSSEE
jgi:DNA-binding Xre family transcriptional regulator